MLGAAAADSGMAGAVGRRGRPQGAEFALLLGFPAQAWARVWQRAGAAVRQRVWVAAWRWF